MQTCLASSLSHLVHLENGGGSVCCQLDGRLLAEEQIVDGEILCRCNATLMREPYFKTFSVPADLTKIFCLLLPYLKYVDTCCRISSLVRSVQTRQQLRWLNYRLVTSFYRFLAIHQNSPTLLRSLRCTSAASRVHERTS